MGSDIERRKADHLDLCATDAVAFKERTTLLEHVRLVHQSLPELALADVDTSITLFGKKLRFPIVIAGMTGGHERAAEINRGLAAVAEARGYGFGLGSQRAMQEHPELRATYGVRDVAPTTLLLGNIGVVTARDLSTDDVRGLVTAVDADALCVHMNPAMEIVQPEGDRDFRSGLATFERLVNELGLPVVAKETGNGISTLTATRLFAVGVRAIDTSGAGGTSWVGVETLRAAGDERRLGEAFWDWGIPTAVSILSSVRAGHVVIATGGIKSGMDVARSIALGATAAGIARYAYQAYVEGGERAVHTYFDAVEAELRACLLLTGSASIRELQNAPKVLTGEIRDWLAVE